LTKEALTPILLDHVVSGNVRSTDLTTGTVNTLNNSISIDVSSGVKINGDINVVLADVQGTNGVVHVIDKVIVTPTK
ncbi:MAG TPA: fasciclin domain-containing protein, partial [Tenuifilaceae bacterium]|nr:fasciclin domain-containing protein [Tenuifilaceae bacterium]